VKPHRSALIAATLILTWISAAALPAWKRSFEPVVLTGSRFTTDIFGVPVEQIVVFAYDNSAGSWHRVPSQIDERGDESWSYFDTPDGLFDANDELIFLSDDAGDYAPLEAWIDDAGSRAFPRFQIAINDTLLGLTRYIYVFRSETPENLPPFFGYINYAYQDEKESIITNFYDLYHFDSLEGNLTDLYVPAAAGGMGIDFFDRMKLRVVADVNYLGFNINNLVVYETGITKAAPSDVVTGPVRVVRRWYFTLTVTVSYSGFSTNITLPPEGPPYDFTFQYYPHFLNFGSNTLNLSGGDDFDLTIKYFRYSFDLNSNGDGMKLFTPVISDALINHEADASDSGMPRDIPTPDWTWWMQTGDPGTFLVMAYVPDIASTTEQLYYKDSPSGTNDNNQAEWGIEDTGSDGSWGDTGLKYTGNIEGEFPLALQLYFLGADLPPDSADFIQELAAHPLHIQVAEPQIVPVELADFCAGLDGRRVVLSWNTASESNNLGFSVERRTVQDPYWHEIAFVPGAGTTQQPQRYRHVDSPEAAGDYDYRLRQIDADGSSWSSEPVRVQLSAPSRLTLAPNYPNPFNPSTVLQFEIPSADQAVSLIITDLLGRRVRVLASGLQPAGSFRRTWDGRDDGGSPVGSGLYFAVLQQGEERCVRKMLKLP